MSIKRNLAGVGRLAQGSGKTKDAGRDKGVEEGKRKQW